MVKRLEREPLDVQSNTRAPSLDVPGAVALGIKLLGLVPKQAPAAVKSAARTMRASVECLQSDWATREASAAPELRPLNRALDNAWSGLLARLEPWESIAADHPAEATKAAELAAKLFPSRLDFTRLELEPEWAESEQRLNRIAAEGMEADLSKLAGPQFVASLHAAHAALGRALGLDGKAAPGGTARVDLGSDLRAALRAICRYALQLVAADDQADDDLSQEIRRSLAVIDAARLSRVASPSPSPQAPAPSPQAPSPSPQAPSPSPQAPSPSPQAPSPTPQAPSPSPQAPAPSPPVTPTHACARDSILVPARDEHRPPADACRHAAGGRPGLGPRARAPRTLGSRARALHTARRDSPSRRDHVWFTSGLGGLTPTVTAARLRSRDRMPSVQIPLRVAALGAHTVQS